MLAGYILKRLLQMIPLLLAISLIVFMLINLPPGDYLTTYIRQKEMSGNLVDAGEIEALRKEYGLDKPTYVQYFIWIKNIVTEGNFGRSFTYNRPVKELVGERLGPTMAVSFCSLVFVWLVSIPVGIYSATHQYSIGDYIWSFIGFIGVSVPGFLVAILVIYAVYSATGVAISGLFSAEYAAAPWSMAKFLNMLPRIGCVIIIVGINGTAGMIRTTRAMMLDELGKQYVVTARAKGVEERKLLYKYPVRVAINPMISTIGSSLAGLVGGETIVSMVFNMPTTGPLMYRALMVQDMYLAGSFLFLTSVFVVVGTLLSDIMLSLMDPRIRFGGVVD